MLRTQQPIRNQDKDELSPAYAYDFTAGLSPGTTNHDFGSRNLATPNPR
jgi:hypothetical protein